MDYQETDVRTRVQRCFLPVVDILSRTSATLKIQPGSADLVSQTDYKKNDNKKISLVMDTKVDFVG